MTIEIAKQVGPDRIDIAYERFGDPHAPPVLLIMGIGAQLIGWPDGLVEALVARGLHVIRFDNRDVGESTHRHHAPAPNLPAALMGDISTVSYTLSTMAADTAGLIDALGFTAVHVVGASMGGFIAQAMAIEHPRVMRSLTSIMSSTGDRAVGQPAPEVMAALMGPPAVTREQVIERARAMFRIVGSPGFEIDYDAIADRSGRAFDRCFDPVGVARQAVAVIASGDRTAKLRDVTVPTLVIHGSHDKMCDVSGGRATAAAIPGAELVVIDGMGHDLPRALWPRLSELIGNHVERVERGRRTA
jgi:pimeloyl-ACP methyl ester carboxylesterase